MSKKNTNARALPATKSSHGTSKQKGRSNKLDIEELFNDKKRPTKDALMNSIQNEVSVREKRLAHLDQSVVNFSHELAADEVNSHRSFVDNEYFLKISQPEFGELTTKEQLAYLALWFYARSHSAGDHRFFIECRKRVADAVLPFIVHYHTHEHDVAVAVVYDATTEQQRRLRALGLLILNFSSADISQRPLSVAEDVFSFLTSQADQD